MPTISHTSEDQLIATLTKNLVTMPEVLVGVGDDCAVIEKDETHHTLLKTDTVVESVHFTPEEDPERVGWKSAARVISDFAAMGGEPEALMVTIILPPDTEQDWIEKVYNGIRTVCRRFKCSVVGGETSSTALGAPKIISISGSGRVKTHNLILRSGASKGDLVYVTGTLGGSIKGKHLDFVPRVEEGVWLASNIKPTAMMDLSDGIAKDLPRLTKLSQVGFEIFPSKLPVNQNCTTKQALKDGEDYELLFTIPADSRAELEARWQQKFPNLKLSHIGHLTDAPKPEQIQPENQASQQKLEGGWDHFDKNAKH